MYLFGSLANGDFDQYSDIDVLFVTQKEISEAAFAALSEMHKRLNQLNSPWGIQLEVSYIPQAALRHFDRANIIHPHMDRGNYEALHMMAHETDWIVQRHLLRENGIVISGPDLKTLIDPIAPGELQRAVSDVLPLWVDPILARPAKIKARGYQSFCVLSLCRMLYTLRTGQVLSKPRAAEWAMQNLDARWKPLIQRAIVGRQNSDLEADPADLNETLEMMKYTVQQSKPTPYPDVNEVLNLLLSNAKEILGDQFVGMYLYGSLSSGDFNPETSDIDFLFVTEETLSDAIISNLESMHKQTWATSLKRAGELEGAYVPRKLIRQHNPNGGPCPTMNEGKFYVAPLGSDWIIQRHVVREYGVIVDGPDPKTLIDEVSPEDLRSSVKGVLQEWWFPMLEDPSWLRNHPVGYHAFAVITMCRVLHALEHGTVTSKPKAALWAQSQLGEEWGKVIEYALAPHEQIAGIDLYNSSLEMIRVVKNRLSQL
jgi:predicted nucleotidyltransferase